jgi:hypothetical protein
VRYFAQRRPSPALVVAGAALLLSLTGTSIAAVAVTLPRNSVGTIQLKNNAVTSAKVASKAVTGGKLADGAITTDKVKDGTLVKADFKAGELPAPTAAFASFVNGPVAVPTSSTQLASLTIPNGGSYVIWGKAYFSAPLTNTITCRLQAESDFDQTQASPGAGGPESMALNVVHTFAAAGTVTLACSGSIVGGQANFIKLSAIQVATLANSG